MAKIMFSGIAGVDMRNKLNGSVFSKNRGGAYVRTKVTPVNPQTTSQQNVRNRLATNSQAWRGLTEIQRQGWIDAVANFPVSDIFGNSRILSGSQLYVRFNNNLALIDVPTISDAPSPNAIPALILDSVTADDSANTVILSASSPVPSDMYMVIKATPNVTPGISFVKNKFRFVQAFAEAETSPFDISAAYTALFGDPVTNNKIFVQAFYIDSTTGVAGIPVQVQTIVVA